MARYTGKSILNHVYNINEYHPLDTRMLVPTYADLTDESNWLVKGESNAFNGMIVAVGSNLADTTKNGVYFLFDAKNPGSDDTPDVTKEENWHKLSSIDENVEFDLSAFATKEVLEAIYKAGDENTEATGILANEIARAVSADQANAAAIAAIVGNDNNKTAREISAEEVAKIVGGADTDYNTLAKIANIVKNSTATLDQELAIFKTLVDTDNTPISAYVANQLAAIVQPKESNEISVAVDGTLGVKELNVSKLIQTVGETFVLSGGTAID